MTYYMKPVDIAFHVALARKKDQAILHHASFERWDWACEARTERDTLIVAAMTLLLHWKNS